MRPKPWDKLSVNIDHVYCIVSNTEKKLEVNKDLKIFRTLVAIISFNFCLF